MAYLVPPHIASLSLLEIAGEVAARRLPPVDQWRPRETIDSHMRIAADGRWFHEGGEVTRPAMVRAFASLLWRDGAGGQHYLITPECRQTIAVEDAAFVATDLRAEAGQLAFRLNTDEFVIAGPDHPLLVRGTRDAPAIYLAVRHGCEARLNRSTWLQLAEQALLCGDVAEVRSMGMTFALEPAA